MASIRNRWPINGKGKHFVRIGRRSIDDRGGDIPMQAVLVVEVDLTRHKVLFRSVDTWVINGVRIGHCELGDWLTHKDMSQTFEPDDMWRVDGAVSVAKITDGLLLMFRRFLEGPPVQREGGDGREEDKDGPARCAEALEADLFPVALPFSPRCAGGDVRFPSGLKGWRAWKGLTEGMPGPESIDVLVVFLNALHDRHDLDLSISIQASLELEEKCESFKRYLIHGDEGFQGGLAGRLRECHWDLQIWILPQTCRQLYRWDPADGDPACEFLNATTVKQYGAQLYIEAHIVPAGTT